MANHRNGTGGKTVLTDDGSLHIDAPRDRDGSFEPRLIGKHERHFTGFDDKTVAIYSSGMTVRKVRRFLIEMYGVEVSPEFISGVTDAVMAEATARTGPDRGKIEAGFERQVEAFGSADRANDCKPMQPSTHTEFDAAVIRVGRPAEPGGHTRIRSGPSRTRPWCAPSA